MSKRKSAPRPHGRGVVLLELLVAGCVVAVLAALAAPSFRGIVERMRLRAAADALVSTFYAARAEAYRRGGHVTLAQSTAPDCKPGEGNSRWRCGWTVFADANEDGVRDAGDELILAEHLPPGLDIVQTRGRAALRLNAWGQFNGQLGVGFILSSQARQEAVMALCISSGGRVQTYPGASRCPG